MIGHYGVVSGHYFKMIISLNNLFLHDSLFYNINTDAVEDFTERGYNGSYFLNKYFRDAFLFI